MHLTFSSTSRRKNCFSVITPLRISFKRDYPPQLLILSWRLRVRCEKNYHAKHTRRFVKKKIYILEDKNVINMNIHNDGNKHDLFPVITHEILVLVHSSQESISLNTNFI